MEQRWGKLPPFCVSSLKPWGNWLAGMHAISWLSFPPELVLHMKEARRPGWETRQSLLDPVRWLLAPQGVRVDATECFKGLHQNPVLCFIWLIFWIIEIYIGIWLASNLLHRRPAGSPPGFSPTGQPIFSYQLPTPTCLAACFSKPPPLFTLILLCISTQIWGNTSRLPVFMWLAAMVIFIVIWWY